MKRRILPILTAALLLLTLFAPTTIARAVSYKTTLEEEEFEYLRQKYSYSYLGAKRGSSEERAILTAVHFFDLIFNDDAFAALATSSAGFELGGGPKKAVEDALSDPEILSARKASISGFRLTSAEFVKGRQGYQKQYRAWIKNDTEGAAVRTKDQAYDVVESVWSNGGSYVTIYIHAVEKGATVIFYGDLIYDSKETPAPTKTPAPKPTLSPHGDSRLYHRKA